MRPIIFASETNSRDPFVDQTRILARAHMSGVVDPAVERLLDAADAAPTLEARAARLREAEARLLSLHAVVPVYFYTSRHLVRPDVRGFEANPLDRHPSRFLSLAD